MKNWNDFERFAKADDKYLPPSGEGNTMATQICTATSKLVYKWFNDGDVFDNTGWLEGWCNDLSSYANWLDNCVPEAKSVFDRLWFGEGVHNESEYVDLLYALCEAVNTLETLDKYAERKKVGTIYECYGRFEFIDEYDDEDEEW